MNTAPIPKAVEHIEVTDPDDPRGMPAYGGTVADAGKVLAPGQYPAYAHYSDGTEGRTVVDVNADGDTRVVL